MGRRITNGILERNDGLHSSRALKSARAMLTGHGFARPRLYHLVLLDGEANLVVDYILDVVPTVLRGRH